MKTVLTILAVLFGVLVVLAIITGNWAQATFFLILALYLGGAFENKGAPATSPK